MNERGEDHEDGVGLHRRAWQACPSEVVVASSSSAAIAHAVEAAFGGCPLVIKPNYIPQTQFVVVGKNATVDVLAAKDVGLPVAECALHHKAVASLREESLERDSCEPAFLVVYFCRLPFPLGYGVYVVTQCAAHHGPDVECPAMLADDIHDIARV